MRKVIVTGFEPFGDYEFNPTQDSAEYFDGREIGEFEVKGLVLPCVYRGAFDILKETIEEIDPVTIVSTGLSSSVQGIRVETVGRNIMHSKYADAKGYYPDHLQIVEEGEEFIKTNADNIKLANRAIR